LEGLTKEYHCQLLIGETVEEHVRDVFFVRTVGLSRPKGKTHPLEIFTVIDEKVNGAAAPAWLSDWEEGVRLYRNREFAAGAERFKAVRKALPGDWLAGDYLENCEAFLKNPPPPQWNAVDVMKSK
jgi:adenylate cyclase